ncbi:MAG: hypothetical protein MUO64_22905 [Anaerolineales bacterium]|nr:hypothetical protein [Anaerolineales bacterium]
MEEIKQSFKVNPKRAIIPEILIALIGIAWFAFYCHYNDPQNRYIRRYDDANPGLIYSQGWENSLDEMSLYGTVHISSMVGETVSYVFNQDPSKLVIIYPTGTDLGTMTVEIDGKAVGEIDQNAETKQWKQQWRSKESIPAGIHTLRLTHASGDTVAIDAIILDSTGANKGLYIEWDIARWVLVWVLLVLLTAILPLYDAVKKKFQQAEERAGKTADEQIPQVSRRNAMLLAVVCILLIAWQNTFALIGPKLDFTYDLKPHPDGISRMANFFYFYYYFSLFPVSYPDQEVLERITDKEDAIEFLEVHGKELTNQSSNVIATGDFGRIWLFYPTVLLKGDTSTVSANYFNQWLFIFALVVILLAAWWVDCFALGILLIAFLGSHPFQIFQVYADGRQVFSLPISIALIILGLHLPLILDKKTNKAYRWALPVITGIILGTAIHIRAEITAIILSIPLIYLLAAKIKWRDKIVLCLLLVLSFWLVKSAWTTYFVNKFDQAIEFVKEEGGKPWNGPKRVTHDLWTVLWAGLGDFDTKYGYAFADSAIYNYINKALANYPLTEEEAAVAANVQHLTLHPKYEQAIRDKVLSDILRDPLWYLDILAKRIQRTLVEVAPVRLAIGGHWITFPITGVLLIPVLLGLVLIRHWPYLKLLLFPLPLASLAFFVFSGWKNTYYSIFLQVLAAICCALLWEVILRSLHILIMRYRERTKRS